MENSCIIMLYTKMYAKHLLYIYLTIYKNFKTNIFRYDYLTFCIVNVKNLIRPANDLLKKKKNCCGCYLKCIKHYYYFLNISCQHFCSCISKILIICRKTYITV